VSARPIAPEPFRIEPIFSERLWGSRSLAPFFPEMRDLKAAVGEAWLTAVDCRIANGPLAGQMLGQAWKEMTIGWRGSQFQGEVAFPLLLKFIFPTDKLSIQVHPGDAYAGEHETAAGGRGKTEMWHVISAEPGARLLAGLNPGVTRERFLAALANHALEDLFQSHEVHAGDTFFIPAGMPHTIGPNMVICEVQEYSDLTYRIYDYDRLDTHGKPRELHIEKALDVMNYDPTLGGKVSTQRRSLGEKVIFEHLVSSPYFETDRWEIGSTFEIRRLPSAAFRLWIFLYGAGNVSWFTASEQRNQPGDSSGSFQYRQGECWFMPPNVASFAIHPEARTVLIETQVPDRF
jgi:mannose-6-phosphate isomerase